MFTDPRTWTAQLYFLLMLPLGTAYFSLTVTMLAVAVTMVAFPVLLWLGIGSLGNWGELQLEVFGYDLLSSAVGGGISIVIGLALIVAMLHLARFIGHLHGKLAKHLLVTATA